MTSGPSNLSPEQLDGPDRVEARWADPERRKQMEDLARELSGDRPRWRVLERVRGLLRRRRGG